ncbi:hypothetical protein NC653_033282 [Populus alba x Populus x berolinensis]|uniref:Protein kinase domain-containing protein n=1 Tax=Populus alba x Populus x berolinensis TaxID=444605 RepID=A0AAD6PZ36_9ROSI|nr:hypothetical protein NC653_033282 [Populus alba x Populus x berolinensis]
MATNLSSIHGGIVCGGPRQRMERSHFKHRQATSATVLPLIMLLEVTALHMTPEPVVDHVQEAPSDIWALGRIVFEMLTGKPVWDLKPETTIEKLLRKAADDAEEGFSAAGSTVLEPISQVSSWQRPLINTIPAGSQE